MAAGKAKGKGGRLPSFWRACLVDGLARSKDEIEREREDDAEDEFGRGGWRVAMLLI